jgi:BASS family bile acid:Na+ symporter
MAAIEATYAALLILALMLNGVAIAGGTPLRVLAAPLRERGLLVRIVLLDLVLVPLVAVGVAMLLDVDPVTRAGLVLVSAASCGPVSIALTRLAGGDVPLSVTLVVGLGALNLATVPLVTTLLLPSGLLIPIGTLLTTLLGLAVAPLLVGRAVAAIRASLRISDPAYQRLLRIAARSSNVTLLGAISVALLLEPGPVLEALAGPVLVVAVVVMLAVTLGARVVTSDPSRVRTLSVAINARAVGLALALATLHLGDVEGLRATVLAYGGLTQLVPILVVLVARRLPGRGSVSVPESR